MEDDDFISKTRRKKQMLEVQELGVALAKLSAEQLARFELPEELREAVLEAKRFTKHEAIRRQMQYIGRMMRGMDVGAIAEQLAALHAPSSRQTALFHLAEKWRTDLLSDPAAVERFVSEYPGADPAQLRSLVEAAAKERRTTNPPRRFRELFHAINAALQQQARSAP
jgi:ribosome-associated protein